MKVLFIVIGIIILIATIIALRVFFGLGHPGNAAPYALRRQLPRDNSPLRGKTILCLGSSISSGFSSGGVSRYGLFCPGSVSVPRLWRICSAVWKSTYASPFWMISSA